MMSATKALILGGHGKVSLLLTELLLRKSWNVTSVVRNSDHEQEILALGKGQPGNISVLVSSLEDDSIDIQQILNKVGPKVVIWSAGAGGKGGPSRTKAVDEIAAKRWIKAVIESKDIQKFLNVSYIGSRRNYPSWWNDEDKQASDHVNTKVLPAYFEAKVAADYYLAAMANKRAQNGDKTFQAINLRPGTLTDTPGTGKVRLGKTSARGEIPRADVAAVAVELLERDQTRGWYDLLSGDASISDAVDKLVKEGFDSMEGEDVDTVMNSAG